MQLKSTGLVWKMTQLQVRWPVTTTKGTSLCYSPIHF